MKIEEGIEGITEKIRIAKSGAAKATDPGLKRHDYHCK
jgi:hypothetical protein